MIPLNKSYKNRKVSLTIHCKYKYLDSTVQRAEDRRQKFAVCRLPFAVNVKLNLSNVARTLSEFVRVTPSPSTFNATLYQNAPRESRNKSRDQSTSAFFMSTNKMAEIVDSEAAPVDTFVPEARLDDNDRRKLIAFYKEKPILWDTSLKLSKKAAKEQKETALKDLDRGALSFQLLLKTSSSSKLSIKRRICRNFTFLR